MVRRRMLSSHTSHIKRTNVENSVGYSKDVQAIGRQGLQGMMRRSVISNKHLGAAGYAIQRAWITAMLLSALHERKKRNYDETDELRYQSNGLKAKLLTASLRAVLTACWVSNSEYRLYSGQEIQRTANKFMQ